MIQIVNTNKQVNLPRPVPGSPHQRTPLEGTIKFGPFTFGVHRPLDVHFGVAISELNSEAVVAFGVSLQDALTQLRQRLEDESVSEFIAHTHLLPDCEKQRTDALRGEV